jgi:acetylornithine/succinyldiaminopimelate/putrescine aminotransferase
MLTLSVTLLCVPAAALSVRVVEIRSVGYDFSRDSGEGQGLLVGLELNAPVQRILAQAAERGVLLISAGEKVLRLVPPLIISEKEIDTVMDVVSGICGSSTVAELSAK